MMPRALDTTSVFTIISKSHAFALPFAGYGSR